MALTCFRSLRQRRLRRFAPPVTTAATATPAPHPSAPLWGYGLGPGEARRNWPELAAQNRAAPPTHWEPPVPLPPDSGSFLAGVADGDCDLGLSQNEVQRYFVGYSGGTADLRLLRQLSRRLGSPVEPRRVPGSGKVSMRFHHRETLLRLALLLGGEVRHPERRQLLNLLREDLGLAPAPLPQSPPSGGWFGGHFTTDGSSTGLGPRGGTPRLAVTSKHPELLQPWLDQGSGQISNGRSALGQWQQWYVDKPAEVLAWAARLRRVYRHWHSPKDRRLALLPLVYALRDCGAHRRPSPLYPYWQQLLGLWQLQKAGGKLLVVRGRGRLAAARPLAQRLRRSLQRLGQPEGTRWRRLVALWHALPADPALRPRRRWRTALVQTLNPADPLLGPVLAAPGGNLPKVCWPKGPASGGFPPTAAAAMGSAAGPVLLAALLEAAGFWNTTASGQFWLRLTSGLEQRPLLAAVAHQLLVAAPRSNGSKSGIVLRLPSGSALGLLAMALPHCRLGAPPLPAGVGSWPLPAAGSALATESTANRLQWALTVALLRSSLTLVAGPDGRPEPQLWLENATWRGAQPERERTLLGAVAVAVGAPEPRWRPTADGRRGSGVWRLVVADGPLTALAEALATYPLPVGGRWPLLPEALALAALDPADPATADRWAEFRSRWGALPSGRALGGGRKPAPLGDAGRRAPPQFSG
jgi:hypothetical protein